MGKNIRKEVDDILAQGIIRGSQMESYRETPVVKTGVEYMVESLEKIICETERQIVRSKVQLGNLEGMDLSAHGCRDKGYIEGIIAGYENTIDSICDALNDIVEDVSAKKALDILTSDRYGLTGSERVVVTEPDIEADMVVVRNYHFTLLHKLGYRELESFKAKNKNFLFIDQTCREYIGEIKEEVREYLAVCSRDNLESIMREVEEGTDTPSKFMRDLVREYPVASRKWLGEDQ